LALDVFTAAEYPAARRGVLGNLALFHFRSGHWQQAEAACNEALALDAGLLAGAYTDAGRQAEVAAGADLFANSAYCLLQLGRPADALTRLERGKARLLTEALLARELAAGAAGDLREAIRDAGEEVRRLETEHRELAARGPGEQERSAADGLRQARGRLNALVTVARPATDVGAAELREVIPADGALIAPVVTSRGGAVFVLPHGCASPGEADVLWRDELTTSWVATLLRGPENGAVVGAWFGAINGRRNDPDRWLATIQTVGRDLWDVLIGPIHDRLTALGLRPGTDVVL
jgi:tetratricopeptide (TPR) repeat protein